MAQHIFVSYNFNDRKVANEVKAMIQSWQGDIDGHIIQVENDVSYNGNTAIEWELNYILQDCDAVLFVLGENPHNSPWLAQEIQQAKTRNLPVFVVKLPNTQSPAPDEFNSNKYVKLSWDSKEISESLNQLGTKLAKAA